VREKVACQKKALEMNDEEAHSGQFDIDIIKFFKPVSTNLDQSSFKVDR
jgi:hypothetical protein